MPGIVLVAAGIWLGGRIRRLASEAHSRTTVLVLQMLPGIDLVRGTR